MNKLTEHNSSELLNLLVDGELPVETEAQLFAEIAGSDSLKVELKELLALRESVRNDTEAFTPPPESRENVFAALGITRYPLQPGAALTSGAAGSAIISSVLKNVWAPIASAVLATFFTALVVSNVYENKIEELEARIPVVKSEENKATEIAPAENSGTSITMDSKVQKPAENEVVKTVKRNVFDDIPDAAENGSQTQQVIADNSVSTPTQSVPDDREVLLVFDPVSRSFPAAQPIIMLVRQNTHAKSVDRLYGDETSLDMDVSDPTKRTPNSIMFTFGSTQSAPYNKDLGFGGSMPFKNDISFTWFMIHPVKNLKFGLQIGYEHSINLISSKTGDPILNKNEYGTTFGFALRYANEKWNVIGIYPAGQLNFGSGAGSDWFVKPSFELQTDLMRDIGISVGLHYGYYSSDSRKLGGTASIHYTLK